ncbi:MAG: c-type cytochrome [Planctomycetota bacterium]
MKDLRGLPVAAAAVAVSLLLLQVLLHTDPTRKNFEYSPDMAHSRAAESFADSAVLPGGQVEQPLVAGVVVRDRLPLEFGPGPEEAARAGRELVDPLPPGDAAALQRGAQIYAAFCVVCHDARGNGQTLVVARGMLPPPSLHGARAKGIADGEIFHILTFGQGNMASYAAQIEAEDRWKVIRHVRELQKGTP